LIKGYFLLSRPPNVAIVVASVVVGSFLGGGLASLAVLLACVSAGLILAGGNCLNDALDLRTDLINRPQRPIPSGRASARGASIVGVTLMAVGTALSVLIGTKALAIALSASILLVLYGLWLKRVLLAGNLTVSMLGALAFVYGGVAAGDPATTRFPAVFAFLLHLGREVVKDAEDVKGDRQCGVRSIPSVFGEAAALLFAALIFVLLIGVTAVPFLQGHYGYLYIWFVALGVDLVIGVTMLALLSRRTWMNLTKASSMLKAAMVFGLVALAVSGF
jgi:geranylgeranylglycerol-phosphate geranylgeranyltransferase